MKKLLVCAALGATALVPTAASAQSLPAAVVAVVDLERVTSQCNSCKTAANALRSQVTAYNNREKALVGPLETEAKAIQAQVDALGSNKPDAALQTRATTFRTRQQNAQQELTRQQQQLQRNQQYIQRQISQKLGPIYQQVMQRRGANVLVEVGSTLATSNSLDVTNDVLTALNSALPTIQTVAPAETRQQPQGR